MEQPIGHSNWDTGNPAGLLGDLHPLLDQIGSTDCLATLNAASAALLCPKIQCLDSLQSFLVAYQEHLLYPMELPVIFRAHHHATHHELRELIALDQHLAKEPIPPEFARASRRIGRSQLQRLRPLRDERLVQRYLGAVEKGEAEGWHTCTYGIMLAIYSLPIRQGLTIYSRQTLNSFIEAAAKGLRLSAHDCQELLDLACSEVPDQIQTILGGTGPG